MTDDLLSPERCAAIRSRLDEYEQSDYALDAAPLMTDLRDLLAAYDQITRERDRLTQTVAAFRRAAMAEVTESDADVVDEIASDKQSFMDAMLAIKQSESWPPRSYPSMHDRYVYAALFQQFKAAEAALVVLTQREQQVKALIAEWRETHAWLEAQGDTSDFGRCGESLEQALAGDGGPTP